MNKISELLQTIPENAECLYIILVNRKEWTPSENNRDYILLLEKPWVKKDYPYHTSYLEMLYPLSAYTMRQRYIGDLSDFKEIKLKFILKWELIPKFIPLTNMRSLGGNLCIYEYILNA